MVIKDGVFTGEIEISGKKVFKASDYTSADPQICRQIIDNVIPLTPEYLAKYDIDGNGSIQAVDYVRVSKLASGDVSSYELDTSVIMNPGNADGSLIKTAGVVIRPAGIWSKNINADGIILHGVTSVDNAGNDYTGLTIELTIGEDTLKFVNGVLVSIL